MSYRSTWFLLNTQVNTFLHHALINSGIKCVYIFIDSVITLCKLIMLIDVDHVKISWLSWLGILCNLDQNMIMYNGKDPLLQQHKFRDSRSNSP